MLPLVNVIGKCHVVVLTQENASSYKFYFKVNRTTFNLSEKPN